MSVRDPWSRLASSASQTRVLRPSSQRHARCVLGPSVALRDATAWCYLLHGGMTPFIRAYAMSWPRCSCRSSVIANDVSMIV